ncbi:hypothetical protein YC2023_117442 [Brassica napus]
MSYSEVYQGTWPGKPVVRWSEPWIWNLEAGIWNLEAGTRNPEILEPKEKGGSPVTSKWLSGMFAVFRGTPLLAPPAFGIHQSCKPGRKMLCPA